ncbi:MAG TPA: cytochrome P460 family protein [Bryobacteraceae bacterium]|nr:cytochrome P460 family protein [Bryobacteraceae bacterium]
MRRRAAVFACALFGLAIAQEPARDDAPRYAADGRLILPANYREWIFLSSGLGMTYSANEGGSKDPSFTNVFASPSAYRSFQRTGTWPDKTTLVLEVRDSQSRGSINLGGHYQSRLAAVEVEVKDAGRFPGKWAFFGFGASTGPAKQIPVTASCYGCHAANGAVDNTFVQFYPTLLAVAKTKGTVKPHAGE